jgi:hypothetical protein
MFPVDFPLYAHYRKHNIVFFAFCNEQLKPLFFVETHALVLLPLLSDTVNVPCLSDLPPK